MECFGLWSKKLLGASGLTTSNKDATFGAKGIATNGAFGRYWSKMEHLFILMVPFILNGS